MSVPFGGDREVDLSTITPPLAFTLNGQGTVALTPTSTAHIWDVTLSFPIDSSLTILEDPIGYDVTIAGTGQLMSKGQVILPTSIVPEPTASLVLILTGLPLLHRRR